MQIHKIFPSGLRLVAKHMPDMYTVSCGVYVDVGSVREESQCNGYSHFIEHLMFKGTTNRNYLEISECMDDIGAQLNAFTAKDNTCYYTKSASTDIEKCLELLSDLYFNSVFDDKEIAKEKSVILEEIATNDDNAEDVCQDLIASATFFGEKLGQPILGTAENIQHSDRHSILNYFHSYYTPKDTVISIAGNFDLDNIDKLIAKYFECNFDKQNNSNIEAERTSVVTTEHFHIYKDVEQSHIALGFASLPLGHENLSIINLMSNIIGGGMSSRLFQIIREQHGLAYSVYSYPSVYKNNGFLEIYCATGPNNVAKVAELYKQIFDKLLNEGVTQQELLRAKAQSKNGLYMSFENSLNVMMAHGRRMLKLNKQIDMQDMISKIDNVTLQDVNKAIIDTFTQDYSSCYVGKKIADHKSITLLNK